MERRSADAVMALALIQHLAIGNNLPLAHIRDFLVTLGRWLVIEFVPEEDTQVRQLLVVRQDIFSDYTLDAFVSVFSQSFEIVEQIPIRGTLRTLFLLQRKD